VSPPRSPVTAVLTRTSPFTAGSLTGGPTAVTGPILAASAVHAVWIVAADTTARSGGANSSSMPVKRSARAISIHPLPDGTATRHRPARMSTARGEFGVS
jgi:hypothetical protein